MINIQKGIINEKDFANLIDNKIISQLPTDLQNLIKALFPIADISSRIDCWKSTYYEKADIKIKINNEIKGISIKTGHNCSMHQESIDKLFPFLTKIGFEKSTLEIFEDFMEGYVNGKRVSSTIYIENNSKTIQILRNKLNNYYIKVNLIIRFIFQGTEIQNYDCDAIIYGTPSKYIWATKDEILKYLIEYPIQKANYLNFSALNIKNYDRNLRNNPLKKRSQREIQVKWYTLEEDFKNIAKLRNENNTIKKSIY